MNETFSRTDLPLIFAHRGANSFAPENSLKAFEEALRLGCDGVEMDLRYTASGDIIVHHDKGLYRMTGKRGNVQQLSLSQIRELCLQQNINCQVPTFQEALELLRNKVLINLDVKKESMKENGFEEKIIQVLRDFNLQENIIISSFNPQVVKRINSLAPRLRLGFIFRKRNHKMMNNGTFLESMHAYHRILSKRYAQNLQQRGYKVYAWTVDSEKGMRRMLKKGVNGIITNRPEIFYQLIDNQNAGNRKPD